MGHPPQLSAFSVHPEFGTNCPDDLFFPPKLHIWVNKDYEEEEKEVEEEKGEEEEEEAEEEGRKGRRNRG